MRPRTPTRDPSGAPSRRFDAALRAYGLNATSFQLLERDFAHWFDPSSDAAVAYVDTGAAWMVGGEPLARETERPEVAERFVAAAGHAGRRAAFFATEGQLGESAAFSRLLIGEQPTWNPADWERTTLGASRSLRAQLRRAANKGVRVRQLAVEDVHEGTPMRGALDALVRRWQASRAMAGMGFLVTVQPFLRPQERMLFVAELQGRPVAMLSMAPVYARDGWLFENLLREPAAPNGTSELLVDAGMRAAAARGAQWVTLGLAPLSGPVVPWLARVRDWASPFFNFAGLRAFKAKLQPQRWEQIWMAYPAGTSSLRALVDALTAFAGGSLVRFGWRSLLRGPRPVLAAMTVLLIPWTVVLALLPPRWFPSPGMQWAWVVFDVLLIVGLATLVAQWRFWLGRALAVAVSLDAVLTMWQAVTWYAPRAMALTDDLLMLVACAGPLLAAIVLWGTVRRNSAMRGAVLAD